jgi:hypothetical protein
MNRTARHAGAFRRQRDVVATQYNVLHCRRAQQPRFPRPMGDRLLLRPSTDATADTADIADHGAWPPL